MPNLRRKVNKNYKNYKNNKNYKNYKNKIIIKIDIFLLYKNKS
jgi:hypothetical protein